MIYEFLSSFVRILFDLLSFAIVVRILMSWFPSGGGRIRMILHDITEPVLGPFRRIIPRAGMIDFSPIIVLLLLDLSKSLLLYLIGYLAVTL